MLEKSKNGQPLVTCIVGARPNFMKIAPIIHALDRSPFFHSMLVHTGQHYDTAMNEVFFEELGIRRPDVFLGVRSGTHAAQTAAVMQAVEPVLDRDRPHMLLVVGDVNSTLAAALVASKKGIPIAHVEAGLRSYDRSMPEEINRVLTDQISELLFTTERSAEGNLLREGIPSDKVRFVGNVMIDTLLNSLGRSVHPAATMAAAGAPPELIAEAEDGFALVTLHRPSNVDDPEILARLLQLLRDIAVRIPVLFPVHPRTRSAIVALGLGHSPEHPRLLMLPPAPYLPMLGLMRHAKIVLTDSGGVQEETTGLGVPCLTLRESTERPVTVAEGTNTIVGTEPATILPLLAEVLRSGGKRGRRPELWDGHAADRIVDELRAFISRSPESERAAA